ncbi:ATP-grasp domain-containing protein [Pelistega europaea]|uniref:ATP-grasp domain-containing protein n=1 Tax=Pelistega europaea TaxID=106147 RepID=A0A7Y4LCJ7_9BURK|nr:ATP-grasp domain-containing protein [Pelistega europaea]NOL50031.1 ATP-grasp domain-containing protein [Pelistega europaea]
MGVIKRGVKLHILFIDSNRYGLDALRKAKALGHQVSFISSEQWQLYSAQDKASLSCVDYWKELPDTNHPQQVLQVAQDIHQQSPIHAVICTLEPAMRSAAYVAQALQLPFTSVEAVNICRDKDKTRERLAQHHIPSAQYHYAETKEELLACIQKIGLPVILKPRSGAASLMTYRLNTLADFDGVWHEIETTRKQLPEAIQQEIGFGVLVEEYLKGKIISVEIARREQNYFVFMVSARHRSVEKETEEVGISMPAAIDEDTWDSAVSYAKQVIEAIGLDFGLFHIEIMLTDKGPRLVEANPRMMGGSMPRLYQNLTGQDLYETLIALYSGQAFSVPNPHDFGFIATRRFQLAQSCVLAKPFDTQLVEKYRPCIKSLQWDLPQQYPQTLPAGYILGRVQLQMKDNAALESLIEQLFRDIETAYPSLQLRRSMDK